MAVIRRLAWGLLLLAVHAAGPVRDALRRGPQRDLALRRAHRTHANPHVVDAVIGLSVVYKALDNLDGFERWLGFKHDARTAVFAFGLAHGFGLATNLQEFSLSPHGLVANILAFNVGVEIGQLLALAVMLIVMVWLRRSERFVRNAQFASGALMGAGFVLAGYQLAGHFTLG